MTTENNDTSQQTPAETASPSPAAPPPSAPPSSSSGTTAAPAGGQPGDEKAPESALSAVKAVMEKDRSTAAAAASPAPKPAAGAATTEQTATATQKPAEAATGERLTKEQFDALPDYAKTRINALFKHGKTLEGQLTAAKPMVDAYRELNQWAARNKIGTEEYSFALEFIALVRNDPVRAWERIQPVLADLRKHIGEVLPDDLEQEVGAGTISRERAQEIARARAETARLQNQGQERDRAEQVRRANEHYRTVIGQHQAALKSYEDQWKASDPDYAKKAQRTWERMATIMQAEGRPQTKEAAVAILKRARKDVEDWMVTFMPQPKPREPIQSGGTGAQTRAQPKSAVDAAKLGLAALAG